MRLLRSLANDAPVLWLVEDAHLARAEGLRLVTALARATAGQRALLVVTTQGTTDGAPDAPLASLPDVRRVRLGRLAEADVVRLLAEALRSEVVAQGLGGRIAARSDGVPRLVFETLRAFGEHGILKREADGAYVQARRVTSVAVPSSLRGLVDLRLKGLADEDREILDVAAVVGVEFTAATVATVLDAKPVQVLRRLAVLERRTGMVRAAGPSVRFDQRLVQETLYAGLPTMLREEYHALVAEALEAERGPALAGRDAYLVAVHHGKGARPQAALRWLEPAMTFLEGASLTDEYFDTVEAALARPGLLAGAARGTVVLRLAERLLPVAGVGEARPRVREALALADAAGDVALRARATFLEARLDAMTGDVEGARTGFERTRTLALEAGEGELEARATGSLGVLLDNTGRHEEGRPLLEHHLADARRRGNARSEAIAACNLGLLLRHLGRRDDARALMNRHLELAVALGDPLLEAVAEGNLSLLASDAGDTATSIVHLERNLELARRSGSRRSEAVACTNLALDDAAVGRLDRALERLVHSRALTRELGDRASEGTTEWNLGATWTKVGRWDEALPHYDRALTILRATNDLRSVSGALLERSRVHDALGHEPHARSDAEEALAVARALGLPTLEARVLIDLAGFAKRADDPTSATALLAQAEARLAGFDAPGVHADLARGRAGLPDADAAAIDRALAVAVPGARMPLRAELLHHRWHLTGDPALLDEARRLLALWLGHLPAALRDGVETRVPAFAAIRDGAPLPR